MSSFNQIFTAVVDLGADKPVVALVGVTAMTLAVMFEMGLLLGMRFGWRPIKILKYLSDLIPPPRLRKRIQKMLADQAAHATSLRKRGRRKAAYWIEVSTWGLALWYLMVAPIAAVWSAAADKFGGAGE